MTKLQNSKIHNRTFNYIMPNNVILLSTKCHLRHSASHHLSQISLTTFNYWRIFQQILSRLPPKFVSAWRYYSASFLCKKNNFWKIVTCDLSLFMGRYNLYRCPACQGMVWNGIEDNFFIFHTGNFLPFHFHCIPKIFHSIFHFILLFFPYSIPYFLTKISLDRKKGVICIALLQR